MAPGSTLLPLRAGAGPPEGCLPAARPTGVWVCGFCCEKTKLGTVRVKRKRAIIARVKIVFNTCTSNMNLAIQTGTESTIRDYNTKGCGLTGQGCARGSTPPCRLQRQINLCSNSSFLTSVGIEKV